MKTSAAELVARNTCLDWAPLTTLRLALEAMACSKWHAAVALGRISRSGYLERKVEHGTIFVRVAEECDTAHSITEEQIQRVLETQCNRKWRNVEDVAVFGFGRYGIEQAEATALVYSLVATGRLMQMRWNGKDQVRWDGTNDQAQ